MEYYESKCTVPSCGHSWRWVGAKTGYAPSYKAEQEAGKKCPRCGGVATIGLDHGSPAARAYDDALGGIVADLFGTKR